MSRGRARLGCVAFVIVAAMLTDAARADSYHDKPDANASGGICAVFKAPSTLQAVIAVEPFALKAYQAKIDTSSGKVEIGGLPPGEYDLLVKTVGRVYEGITLEIDPEQTPAKEDLALMCQGVLETFKTSEDYFNIKKIVRLTGDGVQARMLVCQTRTKHVVAPSGETIHAHIRRIDLVEMVKTAKVWQHASSRHLLRQEVPFKSPDTKVDFVYAPALGRILVGEKIKDLGEIDLPRLTAGPSDRYATADYTAKED